MTHLKEKDKQIMIKNPILKWIALGFVILLSFFIGIGVGGASSDPTASEQYKNLDNKYKNLEGTLPSREADLKKKEQVLQIGESKLKENSEALSKREKEVSKAEEQKATNTITEGTWTVGTDIEPGTYKVTQPVLDGCYWSITITGSNGSDIVQNDLPTGGLPSVILSEGQDFTSKRCGDWIKQ